MTNTNTVFTLNELLEGEAFGLVVSDNGIERALSHAKRDDFYIGTDVYKWLSSMDILTEDDLEDYFPLLDEEDYIIGTNFDVELTEVAHDNSYNWGGNSSTDIDFRVLTYNDKLFLYVSIHIGGDVRCNYSNGVLIDLGYNDGDWVYTLFADINDYENSRGGDVVVDGETYSIDGDIMTEELRIYNVDAHEEYTAYECVYEPTKEEFDNACIKIVEEAIKG